MHDSSSMKAVRHELRQLVRSYTKRPIQERPTRAAALDCAIGLAAIKGHLISATDAATDPTIQELLELFRH